MDIMSSQRADPRRLGGTIGPLRKVRTHWLDCVDGWVQVALILGSLILGRSSRRLAWRSLHAHARAGGLYSDEC